MTAIERHQIPVYFAAVLLGSIAGLLLPMGRRKDAKVEDLWRDRLAKFRRSQLTVAEFCRREGVSPPSFYQWRKRLHANQQQATPHAPRNQPGRNEPNSFVPVVVSSAAVVEIDFPNGMRVRIPADNAEALSVAIGAGATAYAEVK